MVICIIFSSISENAWLFLYNLTPLAFTLMCHIPLCLILLVLHPFYMLAFPLLHFHCFFFTFKSVCCLNFRCPVCCRTSQHSWQQKSPPQCCYETSCVCVSTRTLHCTCLTCALKVKHLYRLPLNVLAEGWGKAYCWTCFKFQESLFIMLHISLKLSEWVWSIRCFSFIVSVTINHVEAGLLKMSVSTC